MHIKGLTLSSSVIKLWYNRHLMLMLMGLSKVTSHAASHNANEKHVEKTLGQKQQHVWSSNKDCSVKVTWH